MSDSLFHVKMLKVLFLLYANFRVESIEEPIATSFHKMNSPVLEDNASFFSLGGNVFKNSKRAREHAPPKILKL